MPTFLIMAHVLHTGYGRFLLTSNVINAEKVNESCDVVKGDHIIYCITNEAYRPMFRSVLAIDSPDDNGVLKAITYQKDGIQEISLSLEQYSNFPYKVKYSDMTIHFDGDEAVERAMNRLQIGENHYHALFNNSHHFVTFAKTGVEESLFDIVRSELISFKPFISY